MRYFLIVLIIIVTGCVKEAPVQKRQFVFNKWSGYSAECCGWNGYICGDCKE